MVSINQPHAPFQGNRPVSVIAWVKCSYRVAGKAYALGAESVIPKSAHHIALKSTHEMSICSSAWSVSY
jgi:hypothetical protein